MEAAEPDLVIMPANEASFEDLQTVFGRRGNGHPESDTTSGLVAYLDREPAGWCAVEPRMNYGGLLLNIRIPWTGRDEELRFGTVAMFEEAGLTELTRPTLRRVVMRIDF